MKTIKIRSAALFFATLAMQFSCGGTNKTALEKNRRLWEQSRISNYRMKIQIEKTGHRTPMGFAVIEVRGGQVVAVAPALDESRYACGMNTCGRYDTVEEIFAVVEDAAAKSPEEFIVEYDANYGYPKHLRLDFAKRTFDDELTINILQMDALE